jgi:hypothetical protein
LFKLCWPRTHELNLLIFEEDFDRKRTASPPLTGGAVTREHFQGLPMHAIPHAFAQAPTFMNIRFS